jgi:hypothetical protein
MTFSTRAYHKRMGHDKAQRGVLQLLRKAAAASPTAAARRHLKSR